MLCSKIKHISFQKALNAIADIKKKKGGEYALYFCPGCNAYHITSHVKNRSKFLKFKG